MSFPGSVLLSQGDMHKEYSEKRHPLGTRGYTRDGRVFRYAKSAAAISCGRVVQVDPVSALDDALSLAPTTGMSVTYSTNSQIFYLSSGNSIATANNFNDGFIFVSSGSSHIGQYAQIKSAPKHAGAADTYADITIFPEDTFSKKLTTACKVGLIKNPYNDVKMQANVAAGALTGMTVGVTVKAISAADKYFWLQTWGPCAVITSAALNLGRRITVATATGSSGCIGLTSTKALQMHRISLGQVLQVGSSSANSSAVIFLQLAP